MACLKASNGIKKRIKHLDWLQITRFIKHYCKESLKSDDLENWYSKGKNVTRESTLKIGECINKQMIRDSHSITKILDDLEKVKIASMWTKEPIEKPKPITPEILTGFAEFCIESKGFIIS